MDGVELDFGDGALEAIAEKAIERSTGARGLRSIMEDIMMPIMYEIPSRDEVSGVVIGKECAEGIGLPEYIIKDPVLGETKISGELE
jgi:ATP-dependent Clp protease ATP-binding subunit ClpX